MTKQSVLQYVHGGEDGAIFDAWDFLSANAMKISLVNINKDLIGKYKRGKYIEGIVRQTVQEFIKSSNSLSEAISLK